MKSTRYIDGGTNLNGSLKVTFWSFRQLIVQWINQLHVRCLYWWILVVQQWVFKTHGRVPRHECIIGMTIRRWNVKEVGGSNNINYQIKRLAWSKKFPSIFRMPTFSCHYKRMLFFFIENFGNKKPLIWFFCPHVQLDKNAILDKLF
jgi:hypothetical protein